MKTVLKQIVYWLILLLVVSEAAWFVAQPDRRHQVLTQLKLEKYINSQQYRLFLPQLWRAIRDPQPIAAAVTINYPQADRSPAAKSPFNLFAHGVNHCFQPLQAEQPVANNRREIYRWVDKNGKVHFGDQQQERNSADVVGMTSAKQKVAVTLTFADGEADQLIVNRLQQEASALYRELQSWLPAAWRRPVALELRVFRNFRRMEKHIRTQFPGTRQPMPYQQDGKAVAYVSVNDPRNPAMKSIRHEIVHALLTAQVGTLPTWLSEGAGQYFERIERNMNTALVEPPYSVLRSAAGQKRLPLTELLNFSHNEYHSGFKLSRRSEAYAFFFFLRDHADGRRLFSELLGYYADWNCQQVAIAEPLERYYPGGVEKLERGFQRWLEHQEFYPHRL